MHYGTVTKLKEKRGEGHGGIKKTADPLCLGSLVGFVRFACNDVV